MTSSDGASAARIVGPKSRATLSKRQGRDAMTNGNATDAIWSGVAAKRGQPSQLVAEPKIEHGNAQGSVTTEMITSVGFL
jgi:hypothetical protein